MVNKKGIIRIIEAVIALLIVIGALLIIAGQRNIRTQEDLSSTLPPILEEIGDNVTLREKILNYNTSNDERYPGNVLILNEINSFVSLRIKNNNLNYTSRICEPDKVCGLASYPSDAEGDIFSSERIISSVLESQTFSPKKIKIFLWRKS